MNLFNYFFNLIKLRLNQERFAKNLVSGYNKLPIEKIIQDMSEVSCITET